MLAAVRLFIVGYKTVLPKGAFGLLVANLFLFCGCFAWSQGPPASAPARTLHGVVKSGKTPVPGATVTAFDRSSGRKGVGWTQPDGSYKLTLPGDGEYVVQLQMAAFARAATRVTVNASNPNPLIDLEIVLLSRSESSQGNMAGRAGGNASGGRGFQSPSVFQSEAGTDQCVNGGDSVAPSGMPVPGIPPAVATESVAVSGTSSPSLAGMSPDELRSRYQDNQMGGPPGGANGGMGGIGGFGGRASGGGGGPMRFGGRSNNNQLHGTVYYSANDAALNAAPYSLTGGPETNPAYLQQRFGAALGGPLIIPHLYNGAKTFFLLHYNGTLGDTPYRYYSTVPTLQERSGKFSQTLVNGKPVQIFDPTTGLPFANNTIPQGMIRSAAQGLLAYIPLPNLPGQVQNFRLVTAAKDDTNDLKSA
jgi:trimeric autotransporter adhesin